MQERRRACKWLLASLCRLVLWAVSMFAAAAAAAEQDRLAAASDGDADSDADEDEDEAGELGVVIGGAEPAGGCLRVQCETPTSMVTRMVSFGC